MLAQLKKEFLQADAAQVRALLVQSTPEEDPIEHFQYGQRLQRLQQQLAAIDDEIAAQPASVALVFGGRPVLGSHGVRARFGTEALQQFQALVSQRFAMHERGPLGSRGRVPLSDDTQLLVTDVVRGSFGFVLQAADGQGDAETSLKAVVDEVADTLSRMAAADDALFDEAAPMVDDRQLATLRDFFRLLDDEGASLRLVEGDRDFELDRSAVQRARGRVEGLSIDERTEQLLGQIVGWTEYSHKFELLRHGGGVVSGSVSREFMNRAVQEGFNPLHQHVRAQLKVREVRARNRQPRFAYTLRAMEVVAAPAAWQAPALQRTL